MKLISFYLPQFHEIPENNEWWGEGFTEWSNTRKASPLYRGHYQPKEPYKDNYYDLSNPQVMVDQMRMAKKYGVGGFCFYHYWFGGKKLLEKPLEMLLQNANTDLPFCLAWANEPWTRTWDGALGSKEVLMPQIYGKEEEWKAHFEYLLEFFKHKSYIRVEDKPVFIIYRAKNIPLCSRMLDYWNELALENGLSGLYFMQMNTVFGLDQGNRRFSASIDFEPMRTISDVKNIKNALWSKKVKLYKQYKDDLNLSKFLLYKINYDAIYKTIISREPKQNMKNFYGAFPAWDNTARKAREGLIIKGASPKKFEKYLSIQIKKSIEANNEFLFINAWNEWGEGTYLEPDKKYGFAYLHAVKRALEKNNIWMK